MNHDFYLSVAPLATRLLRGVMAVQAVFGVFAAVVLLGWRASPNVAIRIRPLRFRWACLASDLFLGVGAVAALLEAERRGSQWNLVFFWLASGFLLAWPSRLGVLVVALTGGDARWRRESAVLELALTAVFLVAAAVTLVTFGR